MYKTVLTFLVLLVISTSVTAQNVTIPNTIFKAVLLNNSAINTNNDLEIQIIEATAYAGTISCVGHGITDLTGIEAFTALTELNCNDNSLTALDLSNNTALTNLDCHNNSSLTTLNLSNNMALTNLVCYNSSLTALDLSNNTALTFLFCSGNNLTALNLSNNTALTHLLCSNNNFTALDVSSNTALTHLSCSNNNFTALDVSSNTALTVINFGDNNLTALDLSNNTALTQLDCGNNNLTALDLSNNTALTYLDCPNNNITALDLSNMPLTRLSCHSNDLTVLNVANGYNHHVIDFYAKANSNLTCIQVDNVTYSNTNWTVPNHIGYISLFSTNCNYPLDINNNLTFKNVSIYPNPTTGIVNFNSVEQIETITVYNLLGTKVDCFKNTNSIDMTTLPNGIYILNAMTLNGNTITRKMIKK